MQHNPEPMSENKGFVFDYLTLGDGDFTYSYDLCRFLQANAAFDEVFSALKDAGKEKYDDIPPQQQSHMNIPRTVGLKVLCSGIDPLHELKQKYRDADFIVQKILSINGTIPKLVSYPTSTKEPSARLDRYPLSKKQKVAIETLEGSMSISVHHSVNAIQHWHPDQSTISSDFKPSPPLPDNASFKNVIFNHPHIGLEDARLHARFLSHFFYSAATSWLAVHGVLHLTLALGQCERWECIQRAEDQGLILLARNAFKAPPSPGKYLEEVCKNINLPQGLEVNKKLYGSKKDFQRRYQQRRGHCGRSFKTRVDGSETLSFSRKSDSSKYSMDTQDKVLPWQHLDQNDEENENSLKCPHLNCGRVFRDERARKNHIKCVHVNQHLTYTCDICSTESSKVGMKEKTTRVFSSKEALDAHKRATHSSTHSFISIKPDWTSTCTEDSSLHAEPKERTIEYDNGELAIDGGDSGKCQVCGLVFTSCHTREMHHNEFVPQFSTSLSTKVQYKCSKCARTFPQERDCLQHKLFCTFIP
mmetsp:Transcript_5424/g.8069  ORF Transcript_5424/g.8069 Transcript_5424/m.8069 type:complete len:530 (+) Transcript_5424:42-1631(+)